MKAREWIKLIEAKKDELKPAIERAFKESFAIGTGCSMQDCVILDEDGDIRNSYEDYNSTSGDVWKGRAIYIVKFKSNSTAPDYNGYFDKYALFYEKQGELVKKFNEDLDEEDQKTFVELDGYEVYNLLSDHFTGLLDEIEENEIECQMEAFDWEESLDRKIEELKQDAAYEDA